MKNLYKQTECLQELTRNLQQPYKFLPRPFRDWVTVQKGFLLGKAMNFSARATGEHFVTTTGWNENVERRARHTASTSRFAIVTTPSESDVHSLTELLLEVQGLLEEYAPAWYSEDLHNRIEAALRPVRAR